MKNRIKLFDPAVGKEEEKSILNVLRSGYWASGSGLGLVSQFEAKFRKYVGSKNCLALNSGTAALHLALSSVDLRNKEVILPSLSFVSTAHSVVYNGGKTKFVDVDPKTLCVDPEQIEKNINNKTAVILPVHFGGMPSELNKIKKIATENNVILIEDAAHACGSLFNSKKIGAHGNFVCFSFHPVKNLSMPTGGLICINTSNHSKIKKILAAKRWCGITNRKEASYDVKEIGWNFYMNNFSAAIGMIQLKKLDKLNNKRKKIAKQYSQKINLEKKMKYSDNCSYHLYWIIVKNRDKFRKKMWKAGIETGIHYKPIHEMTMYKNKTKLPISEKIGKSIVSLPIHPNLSNNDVQRIISTINRLV